ncbi:alpha/beta hydrolase [Microlunatus antarcticus]|uniref:Phospholipase/carboxylesterase n=1 Tax=Microlunatus antarcticus TaxID=53388 RepID=A0A7W5JV54_9ACTN|nr:serine esterase [Microlunatus antarcticus]MBB3326952.1 phospholipase/carboxylesterase [Microlunatus antarcticus]
MTTTTELWHTTLEQADGPTAPLVVLLHGRGADERDIVTLADRLPVGPAYVALRAPIAEGGGFAWFANRGIGRPLPDSLAASVAWFTTWLDSLGAQDRPVVLVGFSGGATFAGGAALADPSRYAGLATLYATLPFDAGVPTTPDRLAGLPVLLVQGRVDQVIPPELQARTWTYLHDGSGATLTAHRTPGGHGLTADDLDVLAYWLTASPAADEGRPPHAGAYGGRPV